MLKFNLASLRINAGYKQDEAAKLLGVSPATLSNWETGRTSITFRSVPKVCELYGCEVENINFFPHDLSENEVKQQKNSAKLPVKVAAARLGVTEQYIRKGLQAGTLDIGSATFVGKRWSYDIREKKLNDYLGKAK